MNAKKFITDLLKEAGIEVNGPNPWDIQVYDKWFYDSVLARGPLGLGESYMNGWWKCEELDEFFHLALRAGIDKKVQTFLQTITLTPRVLWTRARDLGSRANSHKIGEHHYGIGNDLYQAMLDPYMTYTCGYWREASNLDQAQKDKFDLVCGKMGLTIGMRVLDLGCGWGGFLKYAAEKYGIEGVGVTITEKQVELGSELCRGLPVHIKLMDYRDVEGAYDRVVSIGLMEHVGPKHYRTFFQKARSCVRDDGLFLLHTIGSHEKKTAVDPWTNKYIFPGGVIPSFEQVSESVKGLFVIEDMHNFGHDYYHTLMAWHENFIAAWPTLKATGKYDERFRRMWEYYLLSCAGAFKARRLQLWQFVLSPKGVKGGYESVR